MLDYQNGKIYKLWSPEGIEIYIGSTITSLSLRKAKHKHNSNKCSSKLLFEKYNDVRIELIENCPCNNKEELLKKEGEHIRSNKCVNKYIPDRTIKEWREDNKELHKEKMKEWYEKNREKMLEKSKKCYENNKEQILEQSKERYENNREKFLEQMKEWRENNKEYNKEYYEKNKEKSKERYEKNSEKIAEQCAQPYLCECGRTITFGKKSIHFKSIIHQQLLSQQLG